jgi:hypothetical protein
MLNFWKRESKKEMRTSNSAMGESLLMNEPVLKKSRFNS